MGRTDDSEVDALGSLERGRHDLHTDEGNMTNPITDHAEATVKLGILHSALKYALRAKRFRDALELSQQAIDMHVKLQEWLRKLN